MTKNPPRVRVVVVNYNGNGFVRRCIDALVDTDWPADRLDIVIVDNASVDGSANGLDELGAPGQIRVIRSTRNLGFAGGSNLGMGDVSEVDYVALVNSDAFVDPGWLTPLVDAIESEPHAGAACPKLVFEPYFVEIAIETEGFVPDNGDTRVLGIAVHEVRGGRRHPWRSVRFPTGFYAEEPGGPQGRFRWSQASAVLHAPVDGQHVDSVDLLVTAERPKQLKALSAGESVCAEVGAEPTWVSVPVADCFDVVNNVGSLLVDGGHGADRGFGQRDAGQFAEREDVFAWCGAAVVLDSRYLLDVGLFDPEYFLYYEDFDLAWRGRSRGWTYVYEPSSIVRHMHTASTIEGSPLFDHFVQRNRLLTLVKNAPARFAATETARFARQTGALAFGELVTPFLRGRRGHPVNLPRRLRSFGGFLEHLPAALRHRRAIDAGRTVPSDSLLEWMVR